MAALAAAAGIELLAALAQAALQEVGAQEASDRLLALTGGEDEASSTLCAAGPGELQLGERVFAPGSRIALTGVSGSGKTMVLEQLAGLRGGSRALALDGEPVSAIDLPRLAARFAICPQSAPVLLGTIAENLRLAGADLPDAALWESLETVCLAERVRAFPSGLAERVGEGGIALSGGERKRLSLARALLARRQWLLLDEPTEGLDAATEAQVVDRLRGWLERTGSGLVIASHRPAPLALTSQSIAATVIPAA
jgi:ATP-binding cassette subfamily C protein CydC